MTDEGYRPVPSLAYLYRQAPFTIGPDQGETDAPVSVDLLASAAQDVQRAQKTAGVAPAAPAMVPQGGFFGDGRASTLQDQAIVVLTNPVEMANPNVASVADKLMHSKYIGTLKQLFGPRELPHRGRQHGGQQRRRAFLHADQLHRPVQHGG